MRILILVFDLVAPFFDAAGCQLLLSGFADHDRAHLGDERISQPTDTGRDIARGGVAGDEVLVELILRGREDDAVVPVDAFEVFIALVPE